MKSVSSEGAPQSKVTPLLPVQINIQTEAFEPFKRQLTSFVMRIPDKPPVQGYTTPNSNSILDWNVDAASTEIMKDISSDIISVYVQTSHDI